MPDGARAFTLRPMTTADLDACMALTRAVGWNQLPADWETILRLSPGGCFAAVIAGRLVGTAMTTVYGNAFGWVGMVIVHPDRRRCGIGRALMERCIESLAHCAAVRLDATPMGKRLYEQLDFVDEYEFGRYIAEAPPCPALLEVTGVDIFPLVAADLAEVVAFDTPLFGVDRGAVLAAWLQRAPHLAWIARRSGTVVGYSMGREGLNFDGICPVVALEETIARALVTRALAILAPRPVVIDAFEHTPGFLSWLAELGFVKQRPFLRMYRGRNSHPGDTSRIYAVGGPEVG